MDSHSHRQSEKGEEHDRQAINGSTSFIFRHPQTKPFSPSVFFFPSLKGRKKLKWIGVLKKEWWF